MNEWVSVSVCMSCIWLLRCVSTLAALNVENTEQHFEDRTTNHHHHATLLIWFSQYSRTFDITSRLFFVPYSFSKKRVIDTLNHWAKINNIFYRSSWLYHFVLFLPNFFGMICVDSSLCVLWKYTMTMELRPFIGDWHRSIKCKYLFDFLLFSKITKVRQCISIFILFFVSVSLSLFFLLYVWQLKKKTFQLTWIIICHHQWEMVRFRIFGCGSMQNQKNKSVG